MDYKYIILLMLALYISRYRYLGSFVMHMLTGV